MILVGDSLSEVELGRESTRAIGLEVMEHHARAVRAGTAHTHVVVDLPADTYRDPEEAVASSRRLMDAGADSVKLEGALIAQVEAILAAGIPVMGHVGLLPQTADEYRRQGTDDESAERILADARALDAAGCFSLIVEAVPEALAARITAEVGCPTVGIAAGAACDGQVLVSTDLIGQLPEPPGWMTPRADVFSTVRDAAGAFAEAVRAGETG